MLRRCFYFGVTVLLFSALNADAIVSNDSFSCQVSKQQEATAWFLLAPAHNLAEKFTKSSIEIVAEQDGTNLDSLIINTITALVKEINPEVAANLYLTLSKSIYEKAFAPSNLEILTSSKNKEEFNKNLGIYLPKIFESLSSKEVNLKASICFATFTDETVKEITSSMTNCMQSYFIKLNELIEPDVNTQTATDTQTVTDTQADYDDQEESDTQIDTNIQNQINNINQLLSELSKNILTSIASVFENHGYKIDRQALGL
jgi:hypothetical protein